MNDVALVVNFCTTVISSHGSLEIDCSQFRFLGWPYFESFFHWNWVWFYYKISDFSFFVTFFHCFCYANQLLKVLLSQLAFFFVGHFWTDFSLVNRGSLAGVEPATFIVPSSKGSHCATTGLSRSRRQSDSYFIAYEWSSFVCGKLPYHGHLITRVPRNWL